MFVLWYVVCVVSHMDWNRDGVRRNTRSVLTSCAQRIRVSSCLEFLIHFIFRVLSHMCEAFCLLKPRADGDMMQSTLAFVFICFYARRKKDNDCNICDGTQHYSRYQTETALLTNIRCVYPAVVDDTSALWHDQLRLSRTDTSDSLGSCEMGLMRRGSGLFLRQDSCISIVFQI